MTSFVLILRRAQTDDLGVPESQMFDRFRLWTGSLADAGVLRSVKRLRPAEFGSLLAAGNGNPEPIRALGGDFVIGYYEIEVEDRGRAEELSRACPILDVGGTVEIREAQPFP